MNATLARMLVAAVAMSAANLANAAGWTDLLGGGPAEDLKEDDLRMFVDVLNKTLDAPPSPRQPVEWRNPETGAGGTLLVLGDRKVKNFDECRRVRSTFYSKRRQGVPSEWTACKDTNGRWRLLSAG